MDRELTSPVLLNEVSSRNKSGIKAGINPEPSLHGSLLILMQFDVCE